MNSRIYKLKFKDSLFDLNEDYNRLSDHEKEIISDLDCESFFDYDDFIDRYVCYIIAKPTEVNRYSQILIKNLIIHDVTDLSDDILKFRINLEEELKPLLSTVNSIKYSFFVDDINDWIIDNLDIDVVLDRISYLGNIKKLTKIEKEFLKNFKLP
jgi:hypothetical protein